MSMFKGLHSALHKTKTTEPQNKHPDAIPVQTAATLLVADPKRQEHLKNIKTILNLPPKLYHSLYYKVIKDFAEFTQNLPETEVGMFANEGGFLDHGLERAARALSLCLSLFFPQEKTFHNVSSTEALWIYAVFTAALLLDIGKIAVKYQVDVCNRDGSIIKTWVPYTGSLLTQGKFYRYDYHKENRDHLKRLTTSLLARQILDTPANDEDANTFINGFNWIASNPDVLETWLNILFGDRKIPMTSFMSSIPYAESQIIENYLANRTLPQTPASNNFFETLPNQQHEQDLPTKDLGKEFLQWLHDKIKTQEKTGEKLIAINELSDRSDLQVVEDGVLVNPEIFKKFAQDFKARTSHDVPAHSVAKQFYHLLEVAFESPGQLMHNYTGIQGISATNLQKYVLVSSPSILFPPGTNPIINQQIVQAAKSIIVNNPPLPPLVNINPVTPRFDA